jgi:hypothetical protein
MKSLLVISTPGRSLILDHLPAPLFLGVRVMPVLHTLSLKGTVVLEPRILHLRTLGLPAQSSVHSMSG